MRSSPIDMMPFGATSAKRHKKVKRSKHNWQLHLKLNYCNYVPFNAKSLYVIQSHNIRDNTQRATQGASHAARPKLAQDEQRVILLETPDDKSTNTLDEFFAPDSSV